MTSVRTHLVIGAVSFVPAFSCGLIVDGSLDPIPCTTPVRDDDAESCPDGMLCASGECAPCATLEACGNGLDDDCDGEVDEGCWAPGNGFGFDCVNEGCPSGRECVALEHVGGAECLQPCDCSSTECPDDEVCLGLSSDGENWCVTPDQAGIDVRRLGEQLVGESCDDDEDCRSGDCAGGSGMCVDVCCSDDDCPASMACDINSDWYECALSEDQQAAR